MKNDYTVSAYPNFSPDSIFTKPTYNLNKWLDSMREIYSKTYLGVPFKEALSSITSGWNTVEKRDFETWLSYYQSGNQSKYKTAQFYVNDNIPGYLIPNAVQQKIPSPIIPDFNEVAEAAQAERQVKNEKENKRNLMEEQRKKIIGRLHAAIKHLTAYEGHLLAGEEFSKLLDGMYELLKQIQTVNKVSLSNQLYYDLIIRQSNILSRSGYARSARFLTKFAQNTPGKMDFTQGVMPIASKIGDGVAGSLESPNPSIEALTATVPVELETPTVETAKETDPLDEMLENLNTGGITDENFSYDDNEIDDEVSLDDDLLVEAQMQPSAQQTAQRQNAAPQMPPTTPSPSQSITTEPTAEDMEVLLPKEQIPEEPEKNIDAIINSALSSITVQDAVNKLESVISIFRNRQISREITTIDIMLNKLGLASLFPELGEIIQKNLEANSYVLSRLEKIISQLNGTLAISNIDLTPDNDNIGAAQNIKDSIISKQEKEKKNKEMRKQLEDETLISELPNANIPITQQLSQTPQPTVIS